MTKKIHMTFEKYDYIFNRIKDQCVKDGIPLILPNTTREFTVFRNTVFPKMMQDDARQTLLWMCVLVDCGKFKDDDTENSLLTPAQQESRKNEKLFIKKEMRKLIYKYLELDYSKNSEEKKE